MSIFIKGLKYIPPCQSRFSRQSIDDIVNEQYKTLRSIVQGCLDDHHVQLIEPREKEGFPCLKRILYELQSKKLPHQLNIRARREQKVIRSIRKILRHRPDITVRRTDKSKVFYAVTMLLASLLKNRAINHEQHKKMSPKIDSLELAHLHFIPKPHKPDTPLRPIVAAIHAPATEIFKFLNDLLAPKFLRVARQTTFINGIDLVQALEKYVANGYLKPTTLFITFDVENLYTMIPRQGDLEVLLQFLERNLRNNKIGTLRIDDIMRMARLVLDTNIFVYEKKHYRQIRGGAMGSAFTQTLANIYMLDWEQQLIHDQQVDQEIYRRYIDDVFMTTNLTHDQIKAKLENVHRKDPNIRISYSIQSTIDFLDVTVSNEGGHLKTSIFHKSAAEPYVLPYTSDHPRHVFRNIPYAALLKAARICSNVEDFDMERIRLDLSFLLNEYPPSFISKHFHRFFEINQAMPIVEYQLKVFFNTKLMTDPDRNIERDINRFDDIFHRCDDDIDEEEDTNIDFDNLYMNIGKDNNNDVIEIEQLNDDKNNLIDSVFKEENLSQE
ncbi:unnamed protein product [Rotaria sordida]|uniref:Reverse transcriptase domain-containing protein n=2 Tax=Rotaria sordida TaxID=392033 RepID=A0A816D2W7_9BILA|nr:unnamed protein product [Rotaria sordida]CAF1629315.1 unnamed protein product [Rotaria sordida]